MKLKILALSVLTVLSFGLIGQGIVASDTVYLDLEIDKRKKVEAVAANSGFGQVEYKYQLVSENVLGVGDWSVEFCDCNECLPGLTDSGRCTLNGGETVKFLVYCTPKKFDDSFRYVTYRVIDVNDATVQPDTFTYVLRSPASSVKEKQNISNFEVFPNPINGKTQLQLYAGNSVDINVVVIDVLGNEVISESFDSRNGVVSEELNFENMESGVYFVNLLVDNERLIKKVIVE